MKTTTQPCFSNGTEWMQWTAWNCDRCWKASHYKGDNVAHKNRYKLAVEDDYTKYYCSINRDMDAQAAGLLEIAQRSYDVAQMAECPYRQENRPSYARKTDRYKNEPNLFE